MHVKYAAVIVVACTACSTDGILDFAMVGEKNTMEQIALAAQGCGYREVVLRRLPATGEKDTRISARIRRGDDEPRLCLNRWLDTHPALDFDIVVRT